MESRTCHLEAAVSPSTHSSDPRTIRVLLAEDEAPVRRLVRLVLEREGYTVLDAEDGERAWKIAAGAKEPFDLLVTDVVMPRLGGTDLAARMMDRDPDILVLFMSGYTDDERLREGRLGQGQLFMPKPFTPSVLLRNIATLLETRDSA